KLRGRGRKHVLSDQAKPSGDNDPCCQIQKRIEQRHRPGMADETVQAWKSHPRTRSRASWNSLGADNRLSESRQRAGSTRKGLHTSQISLFRASPAPNSGTGTAFST